MVDRRPQSPSPASTQARTDDPRFAINGDIVDAANDLRDVIDLCHVIHVLTTQPDWAYHEGALATVICITSETAEHGRDAAQRAATATEREIFAHG